LGDKSIASIAEHFISTEKPDIVHIGHAMRINEFITASKSLGIPYIITLTDFWLICPKVNLFNSKGNLCAGPEGGNACKNLCPELPGDLIIKRSEFAKDILFGARRVISPSRFLGGLFKKELGVPDITLINHGIGFSKIKKNNRNYEKGDKLTFSYAGSLNEHKGIHVLIDAFKMIKSDNVTLRIFGSGENHLYVNRLFDMAKNDKRIEFHGVYHEEDVGDIFSNVDVVIIPSLVYESYSFVLHEALACNTPVVASNAGGMAEKIKHGSNGFCFPVGDVKALKTIVDEIIANPQMLNSLKQNIKGSSISTVEQEAYAYYKIYANVKEFKDPGFSVDFRERKLARTYVQAVARDPRTFVDLISPDDEMYIYTKNNAKTQKETASYLYLEGGRECFKSIENIVKLFGKSLGDAGCFLDFACGYGRVTRFLIQEIAPNKLWVSDIYKGAVDFQRRYFKVNGFYSDVEPSNVKFPRKFGIIYVGSLFSHLPENRFKEWLSALWDTLDDGGLLIFSTHGEPICPPGIQISPPGFIFLGQSESRTLSTKEYGITFVTSDWVKNLAAGLGINSIHFLEQELCGYQDIYVATKQNLSSLNNLMPTNYSKGHIDSIRITKEGNLYVAGWACEKSVGAPVKEIFIYAEDELLGKASLGGARPDVANHFRKPACLNSGWEFDGGQLVLRDKIKCRDGVILVKVLVKNHNDDSTYLLSFCETQPAA
jgi:glycosyltransferase involved in cell wall biosynthesis